MAASTLWGLFFLGRNRVYSDAKVEKTTLASQDSGERKTFGEADVIRFKILSF